jgi:hypothetical protein
MNSFTAFNKPFAINTLVCKMSQLLLFLFLFFTQAASAQEGFLVFKKKNKTYRTFMSGSYLQITHRNGTDISAELRHVKKDSISLRAYMVQRLASTTGFVFFDTIYTASTTYALADIKTIYIQKRGFSYKTSEYTAYLAAGVFSIMAVVNGAKFKNENGKSTILRDVAIRGGGLFALGRLFHWLGRENFRLGKKYRLATIL